MSDRVVIIGGSHGAHSVIETLRRERFKGRLTLVSEERLPLCSPTALPYLFGDKKKKDKSLRPAEFYREMDVVEEKAVALQPEKGKVVLEHGKKIGYERLVIATGASAAGLPVETAGNNPVLTLRRAGDLLRIEQRARKSREILIVGAGLIGLHLAEVFSREKKKVHVVEFKDQVLPGLIHPELAASLKSDFEQRGIRIVLGTGVTEIGDKEARLTNGEKLGMDLTIAAVGIRTNLEIVKKTSIAARDGILVNERMQTSIPSVYACGDVAEYRDFFTGESRLNPNLVNAAEQGRIVAEHLVGKGSPHPGLIAINTFRCFGQTVMSVGRFLPEQGDRLLEKYDPDKKISRRMVFRADRLMGAVFCNTTVDGGLYYRLIREKIALGGLEEKLLRDPFLWAKWIGEKTFKE
jgi:NAD(P)H-nitrite reductase large subunit